MTGECTDDTERIRESLRDILHILERDDFTMPPSVHIEVERNCQTIWKAVSGEHVDEIYPQYMHENNQSNEADIEQFPHDIGCDWSRGDNPRCEQRPTAYVGDIYYACEEHYDVFREWVNQSQHTDTNDGGSNE